MKSRSVRSAGRIERMEHMENTGINVIQNSEEDLPLGILDAAWG
jgi:hypothetical protein